MPTRDAAATTMAATGTVPGAERSRPDFALITEAGGPQELRARARAAAPVTAPFSSRSYREPYALAAWFDRPVGVDIERIEAVLPDGFGRSIATADERRELAGRLDGDPQLVAALWSGKEALAKALGDAVAYDPRRLDSPLLWVDGRAGSWRAQRLDVPDGHVGWLCWRDR